MEGGELLLTQYLNTGGVIVPTVQVDEDVSVVGGCERVNLHCGHNNAPCVQILRKQKFAPLHKSVQTYR